MGIVRADDLGWGDVNVMNADSALPTPQIDSPAAGGMRVLDAHSPSALCTSTRYAFLAGQNAWGKRPTKGVLSGYSEALIGRNRATLGTFPQAKGYRIAAIGKWHLAMARL